MAVTIKLKNASGSDPSASDLVVGEVALRTDTAKLFTKKDDNSVAEIGVTALGDNDVTTAKIADDAVTLAKMQNVITDSILGRTTSGTGIIEVLSASSVRGIINVEDGATADQSASEILTLLKTVDGAGSGLDADTLDGISSASFLRSDANDTIDAVLTVGGSSVSANEGGELRLTHAPNGSLGGNSVNVDVYINNLRIFEDGGNTRGVFIDFTTCANNAASKLFHSGNDGSGSGLDADLLDGQEGSYYRNASNINAGTLAAARVATLNQDTTGNAATATALETARTIAGVSFDGSANISLNNNAITNGAGYITSADGGNAATLDSLDSTSFLRSDAADSGTGLLTLSGGLALSGKVGAAITAASDGSTITLDLGANTHQSVTLGGNRTFAAPSNQTVGQSGSIFITQDGTGSRTASFNSAFKFVGGTAPTLSTAANAVDRIDYVIKSSNVIHCAISLDVK